jgi:hypothetical protein
MKVQILTPKLVCLHFFFFHQALDVAELLFAEVLRRAGLSATAAGIPRKDLLQTLKDMDFDTGLVQRLVTHLSSARHAGALLALLVRKYKH